MVSDLQPRKHKPNFRHKKAVTASATLALHKAVLRVFSLHQHFLCKNGQKCTHQITFTVFWWVFMFSYQDAACSHTFFAVIIVS